MSSGAGARLRWRGAFRLVPCLGRGFTSRPVLNVGGAVIVGFTLAVNISRGQPIASVAAALIIAYLLYRLWARAGKPRGVASVVSEVERDDRYARSS